VVQVKGTLVCDTDGSASGGNSVLVDTPLVELDDEGNARFNGRVSSLHRHEHAQASARSCSIVIPAKAGIQCLCVETRKAQLQRRWVPASAGTTNYCMRLPQPSGTPNRQVPY
jgi:hypothetical protein